MSCNCTDSCGVRTLPVVVIGEKAYFVDVRLGQLRSVRNPSDFIDFVPEETWPWVAMMGRSLGDD